MLICLLISLIGRNTLSIDELQEEEGHILPRRRQRLDNLQPPVDRDSSTSSNLSESVERSSPELVNSESSSLEWSDLLSSSSSRASNESTSSDSSDEDSSENDTSSSQIDSNGTLLNRWWTNGLQTAHTESFDVEEVPYSSNVQETLRKVQTVLL